MAETEFGLNTITYALIGGIGPALLWLLFWLREDKRHPEPPRLLLLAFVAGALAVFISFIFQQAVIGTSVDVNELFTRFTGPSGSLLLALGLLIIWSFIEELAKFLGIWLTALKSGFNDEPIDPMVYMITGALGFVAMENTLFILNAQLFGNHQLEFLITGNLRFLGASIVHIVSSAIIGGAMSLTFYSSPGRRFIALIWGFILATLLHAGFNFLIITGTDILMIFILWWVLAIAVLLFFEKVKRLTTHPSNN
ncbi:MAG: PrsW family glutamic-type intramembrane protease [Candidatus Paceibacterota bacterium]